MNSSLHCEIVVAKDMVLRAQKMLRAMIEAAPLAGVTIDVGWQWRGIAPVLMSYGLGHPVRRAWTEAHKANGGRLIGWDLGYWHRDVPQAFSMRCTIDDDHPHRWLRPEPGDRWDRAGIKLREDYDASGPIILAGLGRKQRHLMKLDGQEWEKRTLARLQREHPGREILYRPKSNEAMPGLRSTPHAAVPIERVLQGASLVVCHHSNVAVDACIAGIPVECEDGAALQLYRNNPQPTQGERLAFLRSLAWWQWTPQEGVQAWHYLKERLGE